MRRLIQICRHERGSAFLFTTASLVFILTMGGFAIDFAYQITAKNELQRSMDAAALAGAGKLGFDASAFPTARSFAQNFAAANPYRVGAVNLNANTGNASDGNIVLGIWDGSSFSPSLDPTQVNAVRCQFRTTIPTSFLRLLGFNSLPVQAMATAMANPPVSPPPPPTCLFPIGVGSCPFQGPTSQGCGVPITFITSSGKGDAGAGCLSPPCTNTSAWVSLDPGSSPNASYLRTAIRQAANGTCGTSPYETGDSLGTNNGMAQDVMNELETAFVSKFNSSDPDQEIKNSAGTVVYRGKGWKVYIPVIQTECPTGSISGDHQIVGWTEMIITQVINKGACAVPNHWNGGDNPWDPVGVGPNCNSTAKKDTAMRAVFGYFSCTIMPGNPVPTPVPRTAIGARLKLVQ